jgi:RNA polymerase sigma-70 factor (ECF subfamily)
VAGNRRDEDREFRRLMKRFYHPVARFFANRGYPEDRVYDLAQETFLNVYRGLDGYRSQASEATWVFRIAAHAWLSALRRPQLDETPLLDLVESGHEPRDDRTCAGAPDPLEEALSQERSRLLREAIEELPAQMRHCVLLRVAQDMKYREIAAVMQISIGTVQSQLHEARERLRKRLGKYFDGIE